MEFQTEGWDADNGCGGRQECGGYDRLTDAREQAPVADYFSRQLNVATFVLYRRVRADGTYRYPVPMWDG